jgi:hypothetical protein
MSDQSITEASEYLESLRSWFHQYCRSFYTQFQEDDRNLALKELHTIKVCEASRQIAAAEGFSRREQLLAEIIALFHDLGRFQQYAEYRTFKDSESVNHAALGGHILKKSGVLEQLSGQEQDLVILAVQLHNIFLLPVNLSPVETRFLRLIRDADKIDIWRVMVETFNLASSERASAVGLGFPELHGCTEQVLDCLARKEIAQLAMLRSLNDFKLMQLSWVYDINFVTSFRLIHNSQILTRFVATLPDEIRGYQEIDTLMAFVRQQAESNENSTFGEIG